MDTIVEDWLPLASFAFVASITPGPNNLMLAASGVAFGWRRTLPHMLGVPAGFLALLVVCGLGVGALIERVPAAGLGLRVFGTIYLLYLAWVMRNAISASRASAAARPLSFVEAALFQFANPKGWIMALTAVSVFMPMAGDPWSGLAAVCLVCVLVNLPCIATWVSLGVAARRSVGERWRRIFSTAIVVLMLYTVAAIWI